VLARVDEVRLLTKVLYIEHDDDNRYMLKMRLERADDFEVLVSDNSEQGCKLALTEHPDDPDGPRNAGR
jgi:hypothetical protein